MKKEKLSIKRKLSPIIALNLSQCSSNNVKETSINFNLTKSEVNQLSLKIFSESGPYVVQDDTN